MYALLLPIVLTEHFIGRFILVACDGLWKVFSTDEAAAFVTSVLEVSFCDVVHMIS